jgi:hypothetical protein
MLYRVHLAGARFEFVTLVVNGIVCIGSHKSNSRTITTTTALFLLAVVSVLLRYTDSDYPFGIFKLFLMVKEIKKGNRMLKSIWFSELDTMQQKHNKTNAYCK